MSTIGGQNFFRCQNVWGSKISVVGILGGSKFIWVKTIGVSKLLGCQNYFFECILEQKTIHRVIDLCRRLLYII